MVSDDHIERICEIISGAYRVIDRDYTQPQKKPILTVLRGSQLVRADGLK